MSSLSPCVPVKCKFCSIFIGSYFEFNAQSFIKSYARMLYSFCSGAGFGYPLNHLRCLWGLLSGLMQEQPDYLSFNVNSHEDKCTNSVVSASVPFDVKELFL